MESSSKCSILVQLETCSQERIAVLSKPIARNRLVRHSTCDWIEKVVYRKTGEEFFPQSTNPPKKTACRSQA